MVRLRLRSTRVLRGRNVEAESPFDLLLREIREAEVKRQTAEEELNRTPGWRVFERARRRRRFERRRAAEQQTVAFAEKVSGGAVEKRGD